MAYCRENMDVRVSDEALVNVAAFKGCHETSLRYLWVPGSCHTSWNALQGELGIMPCAANALLNEEGVPVVCETDIHGAVTALIAEGNG